MAEPPFEPNRAERTLGRIGAVLALPTMLPMLALMALIDKVHAKRTLAARIATPFLFLLVFIGFLISCIVFVPYGIVLHLLLRLGIVRLPPKPEEEEEEEW